MANDPRVHRKRFAVVHGLGYASGVIVGFLSWELNVSDWITIPLILLIVFTQDWITKKVVRRYDFNYYNRKDEIRKIKQTKRKGVL